MPLLFKLGTKFAKQYDRLLHKHISHNKLHYGLELVLKGHERSNLEHPVWLPHGALDVQAPHLQNISHSLKSTLGRWLCHIFTWCGHRRCNKENKTRGWRHAWLTFCQFFFSNETRKLTLIWMFCWICFSSIDRLPTATPMQRTFLSWNLTVAFVSFTFDSRDSWWVTKVGNLPVMTWKHKD